MNNLREKIRELHIETIASVLILVMAFLLLSGALITCIILGRTENGKTAEAETETEEILSYVREEEYRTAEKPSRNMRSVTLTVSFDQNYGGLHDLTVFSGKYFGGSMQSNGISAPEPDQRDGFTFVEWRDSSGNAFDSTALVEKDMMYYGVWTEDPSPTVTYNPNGGRFRGGPYTDLMPAKVLDGSILVERDWDVFTGWNTAWDGTGESYKPGETIDLDKKVTLYAQWNGLRLLTFVPNGGKFTDSGFKNPVKVELGKTIEAPKISKLGYKFEGWYETEITPFPYDFSMPVTRDAVLYARWSEDNTKIRIGLINGELVIGYWELTGGETSLGKDTNGKTYSSLRPKKNKFTLYGWYTAKDAKALRMINPNGSIVLENFGMLPKPDENKRYTPLYACWKSTGKARAVDISTPVTELVSGSSYILSLDDKISKAAYHTDTGIQSDDESISPNSYYDMTDEKTLKVLTNTPVAGKSKTWTAVKATEEGDPEEYYYIVVGSSSSSATLYLAFDGEEVKAVTQSDLMDENEAKWYMDETGTLRHYDDGFLNYDPDVKDKKEGSNPLIVSEGAVSPVTVFEVKEQEVYSFQ